MFHTILFTQWKWSRGPLVLAACTTFALPLLSIRGQSMVFEELDARRVLIAMRDWGYTYALAALGLGVLAGLIAWRADHAGRHVYALSLPVERWRYTLMRFGAGAVTLIGPIIALWIGATLATATATIPPGLEGHATALAFRFLLAVLVAYALCFAAGSTSPRIAGYVLGALGGLVVCDLLIDTVVGRLGIVELLLEIGFGRYGLLHVFIGRWMLIDV
jgi:hypothetical protein